ncbi:MAG: polysaccharide biosynthesis tyrosine autokinase [Sulfuricella sp.]|nr:polysaccharide biosynthesis tyrosine autokinase [Sulfuricella sp.]
MSAGDQSQPESKPEQGRALTTWSASQLSTQVLQPGSHGHEPDEDAINLREYWAIIVKRKWTVISFFLIVLIAVVTATFLQTPVYRASLTLQIERTVAKIVEFKNVGPDESSQDKDFYQTQYELLKSRTLAERVIGQMGLMEHPLFSGKKEPGLFESISAWAGNKENANRGVSKNQKPDLVQSFLNHLTVEPVRNSRLVKVNFDSPDPELSARVANAMADVFIKLNLERRMDASSYAKTFLEERLQQIKSKLEDSERQLVDFARQEAIINVDDKQSAGSQRFQELNSALGKATQERVDAEAQYQQLQGSKSQAVGKILDSPLIQKLKESKAKLESDYREGLQVYKPAYPKMQQLEGQIAEIQAKIDGEVANVIMAIKSTYEAARYKESMVLAQLNESKLELLDLQGRSIQYTILKRETDTNRQLYDGLLQRLKEVGVAGGADTNNVSVVDKAEVPNRKFKPSLSTNALIAALLGLFGGIGLAFLFEHLDDTIKQPEDIERLLGIATLGVIPLIRGGGKDRDKDSAGLALSAIEDPRSAFAEAYRSVRTALQFSTADGAPRVLMLTSTSAGEGKSTSALSLGIHFAQAGKRVLLVDADLRNPSLHRTLEIENTQGLTNVLAGEAQAYAVTKPTTVSNLFIMPTGPLPPNPAELLSGAKMLALINLAAEKFDHVIIDGPPVLGLADALVLGNLAEATILVVEAGITRRGFAQNAIKRLRSSHTRLLGGILVKVDARGNAYGYHQNYYYYNRDAEVSANRLTA